MTRLAFLLAVAPVVASSGMTYATTIHVPGDHPTIQAGIAAASNSDTVLVAAGTYTENVDVAGKSILLLSVSGRDSTFLEPANPGDPIVRFTNGENRSTILQGFTVRNTTSAPGILIDSASPTIRACDVSYCTNPGYNLYGGGILCEQSGALIQGNRIHHNSADYGGGVGTHGRGDIVLEVANNEIYANSGKTGPGIGCVQSSYDVTIHHNVVHDNTGTRSNAAGIYFSGTDAAVYNNTVVDNTSGINMEIGVRQKVFNNIIIGNVRGSLHTPGDSTLYNNVWYNAGQLYFFGAAGDLNISGDPQFFDYAGDDFSLGSGSPCIDAGHPGSAYNDPDGSRNDMGAVYPPHPLISPVADSIGFGPSVTGDTVFSLTPTFLWSYNDSAVTTQAAYEIEVNNTPLWNGSPLWSSGQVTSSDRSCTYGGAALSDFTSFFIRLRLNDGVKWGDWRSATFFTHAGHVIYVPADRAILQEAIEIATDGDTIVVSPGSYGGINFLGKAIVVRSTGGAQVTEIGRSTIPYPVVDFGTSEGRSSVLEGFAITGHSSVIYGVRCVGASPTIRNCDIHHCYKGGIAVQASGILIRNCRIYNNREFGVSFDTSGALPAEIDYCDIYRNTANLSPGIRGINGVSQLLVHHNLVRANVEYSMSGGAIHLEGNDHRILNNTVVDNSTGIWAAAGSGTDIRNNLVVGNYGVGIEAGTSSVDYNDTWANGSGNSPGDNGLAVDPLFGDLLNGDYGLGFGSPCVDAGDPDIIYNDTDGTQSDIGAGPFAGVPVQWPKVRAVFGGSVVAPGAQYIELQLPAWGRSRLAGRKLWLLDSVGTVYDFVTLTSDLSNGANQASILFATPEAEAFFDVTADFTLPPVLIPKGGKICLENWDCVSWGNYIGSSAGSGSPFRPLVGLRPGSEMRRRLDGGVDSLLDEFDDGDNSNANFEYGVPAPRNNAGVIGMAPPSVCGNGVIEGLEECDDGNTIPSDGCDPSCLIELTGCPVLMAGDVNASGTITAADIIYVVNYVFLRGGPPIPCTAVGDVNCSRAVTSADIIFLVNYTFKSGPPPCDVCQLIWDGLWTCN